MSSTFRPFVLALAFAAAGVQAAELGEATVRSYIGQPLAVDIELTDLSAQDQADLQARLARPDVFQGANVPMHPALAGATISVVKRDQRRLLHVTTSAPVQADVLHLFFQLASGGKERVRSVTLWLTPDPAPPQPVRMAATPAAPAERADKPAARRQAGDNGVSLVASAAPGKEATKGERELLDAVERAFATRGHKPAAKADTPEVRKEALKFASSADDFKRGVKPAKAATAAEPDKAQEAVKVAPKIAAAKPAPVEQHKEPEAARVADAKPAGRLPLASKVELAEAARATRAGIEEAAKAAGAGPAKRQSEAPVKAAQTAPAAASQQDPAMMKKLAELENKLKTLQTMLATAGPAAAPVAAKPAPVSAPAAGKPAAAPEQALAEADKPQPAAPQPAGHAAAPEPKAELADAHEEPPGDTSGEGAHVAAAAQPTSAAAVATVDEPKPMEPPKAAEPPPPETKEKKISRPKILTFLFAGSLVLLLVFGIVVHLMRKAKMKRSPIVRQSWRRDDDDGPRTEPTADVPVLTEKVPQAS